MKTNFSKHLKGLKNKVEILIFNFLVSAWGSHWDKTDTPYLTAAAAIGMTVEDITAFIRRLDKVMASR